MTKVSFQLGPQKQDEIHVRGARRPWGRREVHDASIDAVKVRVKAHYSEEEGTYAMVYTDDMVEIPHDKFAEVFLSPTIAYAIESGDLEIDGGAYIDQPEPVARQAAQHPARQPQRPQRPPVRPPAPPVAE